MPEIWAGAPPKDARRDSSPDKFCRGKPADEGAEEDDSSTHPDFISH
jgi:hypothetical protein